MFRECCNKNVFNNEKTITSPVSYYSNDKFANKMQQIVINIVFNKAYWGLHQCCLWLHVGTLHIAAGTDQYLQTLICLALSALTDGNVLRVVCRTVVRKKLVHTLLLTLTAYDEFVKLCTHSFPLITFFLQWKIYF